MTIAQEEIFGPVLSVIKFYRTTTTRCGSPTTRSTGSPRACGRRTPTAASTIAKRLRAGTVWINDYHLINCVAPFGGYKQSGIGRELAGYGLNEYTEVKHVHWDLGTPKEQKMFGVLCLRVASWPALAALRASSRASRSCGSCRILLGVDALGLELALRQLEAADQAVRHSDQPSLVLARGRRAPGSCAAT